MNLLLQQIRRTNTYFKISLAFILSLCYLNINGQCTVEQLLSTGNNGPNIGASSGQQFVACQTGLIEEVQMHFVFGSQPSIMRIEIYESATGWQNLIWTLDSIPISGHGYHTFDMSAGFGASQELIDGVTYSARFWNIGTAHFFFGNKWGPIDHYPDGFTLNHFGNVVNWSPNFLDRYFRIGINGATVPVELVEFTAEEFNSNVELNWQTAAEENNAGFQIQHSTDGDQWRNIGYVEGRGTTSIAQEYNFTHRSPASGDNYYRLQQIDFDGQFEFSPIRHILMTKDDETHLQIYPNPSSGHFTMSLHNPNREKALVKLFDSTGNLVWEKQFKQSDATIYWEKDFDLPQRELYFLMSQVGDRIETTKVTIVDER